MAIAIYSVDDFMAGFISERKIKENLQRGNNMEHTPTPWQVVLGQVVQEKDNYNVIADIKTRIYDETKCLDEAEANAAFIVRAVNSHDELVEALKYIVNCVPVQGEDAILDTKGYNLACEALAKAEGR